jgi:DNA invertase Pin-like site-specific DNA recombinase
MPRGPLADSYMRLSTPRQRDGDGLRRQAELRDRWLARHLGIPLRETFADIGVSGFRGKHRIRGALSLYLEHIRAGEVIKGDFFLVEDMDRMTREPVSDALKLVISILESGVTICVLNTDWSITLESFNRDASHVFMLAAAIQRANAESRRKSEMLTKSAEGRRKRLYEHGIPFTTQGPPWVSWNVTGFVPNEKASIVRQIFEWAASGVGTYAIARMLNERRVATFLGRGVWRSGYVSKLLSNRAVIGEYQPGQKIEGRKVAVGHPVILYPVVVDPALFKRAQDVRRPPTTAQGNKGTEYTNLFQKLCHCGHCGGAMNIRRVTNARGKDHVYLVCANKAAKLGCAAPTNFKYADFERAVLTNASELNVAALIRDANDQATVALAESKAAHLALKRNDLNNKIETLLSDLEDLPKAAKAARALVHGRIEERAAELQKIEAELAAAEADIEKGGQQAAERARAPANVARLMAELESVTGEARYVLRARIAAALRTFIDRATFDAERREVRVSVFGFKTYVIASGELKWTDETYSMAGVSAVEVERYVRAQQEHDGEDYRARIMEDGDGVKITAEPVMAFFAKLALHSPKRRRKAA